MVWIMIQMMTGFLTILVCMNKALITDFKFGANATLLVMDVIDGFINYSRVHVTWNTCIHLAVIAFYFQINSRQMFIMLYYALLCFTTKNRLLVQLTCSILLNNHHMMLIQPNYHFVHHCHSNALYNHQVWTHTHSLQPTDSTRLF